MPAPAQPRSARRPAASLRETRFADSSASLSPLQLQRLGLTQAEYTVRAEATEAARAAYDAALSLASDEQKHDLTARFAVEHGKAAFKCPGCWLLPGLCVCARLRGGSCAPHRLAVYIHHKEHGRGSNTGVLLQSTLGASLHVSGLQSDEASLASLLQAAGPAAALLWPGEDALSPAQFRAQLPPGAFERGVLLVAIDGCWNGARKMVNRLSPNLTRLRLDADAFPPGRSLLAPVRKYEGEMGERHCTYEAVLAALLALGALPGGEEERTALLRNVMTKVDGLLVYKNRRTAYGEVTGVQREQHPPKPTPQQRVEEAAAALAAATLVA